MKSRFANKTKNNSEFSPQKWVEKEVAEAVKSSLKSFGSPSGSFCVCLFCHELSGSQACCECMKY